MFGLIGHLTSLEHAQSVARELGYPEYADQGLEFWCSAPPQIVDRIKVTSATGQQIEGLYVELRYDNYGIPTRYYCDDCYENNYPYRKDNYIAIIDCTIDQIIY